MRRLTTEQFVERARRIHGDKYDYSAVEYVTDRTLVPVYCGKHSTWFLQHPDRHSQGATSCRECAMEIQIERSTKTTAEFISDAVAVHGERWDYSKTVYTGAQSKLTITCPVHGDFEQLATNHLSGRGCSECAVHNVFHERHIKPEDRSKVAWVYVMLIDVAGRHFSKLGYTTDFANRKSHLKSDGVFVDKSWAFETTRFAGFRVERDTHAKLAAHKVRPSQKFGGATECYPASMYEQLIETIDKSIPIQA